MQAIYCSCAHEPRPTTTEAQPKGVRLELARHLIYRDLIPLPASTITHAQQLHDGHNRWRPAAHIFDSILPVISNVNDSSTPHCSFPPAQMAIHVQRLHHQERERSVSNRIGTEFTHVHHSWALSRKRASIGVSAHPYPATEIIPRWAAQQSSPIPPSQPATCRHAT